MRRGKETGIQCGCEDEVVFVIEEMTETVL